MRGHCSSCRPSVLPLPALFAPTAGRQRGTRQRGTAALGGGLSAFDLPAPQGPIQPGATQPGGRSGSGLGQQAAYTKGCALRAWVPRVRRQLPGGPALASGGPVCSTHTPFPPLLHTRAWRAHTQMKARVTAYQNTHACHTLRTCPALPGAEGGRRYLAYNGLGCIVLKAEEDHNTIEVRSCVCVFRVLCSGRSLLVLGGKDGWYGGGGDGKNKWGGSRAITCKPSLWGAVLLSAPLAGGVPSHSLPVQSRNFCYTVAILIDAPWQVVFHDTARMRRRIPLFKDFYNLELAALGERVGGRRGLEGLCAGVLHVRAGCMTTVSCAGSNAPQSCTCLTSWPMPPAPMPT